jgi:predicted nuclease with TOPRIM domain
MGSDMYVCGFHGEERESRLNKKVEELQSQLAALREENKAWEAMGSDLLETCDRLRAENERLTERAELAEWYITESKTKIFYELLEDIAELRAKALIWHKWPGEKPVNDDSIERIALSEEGKIYLTKTPPSKWCKGNSFRWAEIATRQFRRTDKPGESQGD